MNQPAYTITTMNAIQALQTIPDNTITLLLTDPPYNLAHMIKHRAHPSNRDGFLTHPGIQHQQWDDLTEQQWNTLIHDTMQQAHRILKPNGTLIMFTTSINTNTIITHGQHAGLYYKTVGTWTKTNPLPLNMNIQPVHAHEEWVYMTKGTRSHPYNNHGQLITDTWTSALPTSRERQEGNHHPTQKPLTLMQRFIRLFTDPGDTVCDPYCGSGTTGVASLIEHRTAILNDINPQWTATTLNRCRQTANNPTLL